VRSEKAGAVARMNVLLRSIRLLIIYVLSTPSLILLAPISWIFDAVTIYYPDLLRAKNTPENHKKKVQKVQSQVCKLKKK